MMRLLILLLLLTPLVTTASNAGIVRGLWYDREVFFTGDTVRVYVAVRNNTGADLSGTVEFFVNGKQIERKNIDALDGRIVESWGDWIPEYGTSSVTATLSRTEITSTASGTQAIEVVSALAEDTIFIDRDTDKDGQGDLTDKDDDGDGQSDLAEIEAGTDPLVFDEPPKPDTEDNNQEGGNSTEDNNDNRSGTDDDSRSGNNQSESIGLEQYLTPSPANTAFSSFTNVINTSKKKLDDYREARETKINDRNKTNIEVNEDGFGAIERISETEQNKPKPEKPEGWLGSVFDVVGKASATLYTVLLGAASFGLGHPMLLQILLLLLILYILYRVAKKIGDRPQ